MLAVAAEDFDPGRWIAYPVKPLAVVVVGCKAACQQSIVIAARIAPEALPRWPISSVTVGPRKAAVACRMMVGSREPPACPWSLLARTLDMKRRCAIYALSLLFATGCGQLHPDTPPIIVGQRTVTVSGDDPFIEMEDGTRIGVDGVPSGQSMQFRLTQYKDSNGKMAVDVATVSEPIPKLERP